MKTIRLHKNLSINIRTLPGSARILWWINSPECAVMFDPTDSTFRSCGESGSSVDTVLNLRPRDQGQIKRRLLKYDKEQRKRIGAINKRTAEEEGINTGLAQGPT